MAGLKDVTVGWGNSFHKYINFNLKSGAVVDITGWTIYFTIKEYVSDLDSTAKVSYTNTTHLNPTLGQSEVFISKTTMKTLEVKEYYYDIKVKNLDGEIFDIVPTSKFRVNASTTLRASV